MDDHSDEYELALRARDGDREALVELVEQMRLRLFALAYSELRHHEDAQDAVASALLKICQHVGELREPGSIRAWMQTIVRREAHALRRSQGTPLASLDEAEPRNGEAEPSLLRLEIENALRWLPDNEAEAIRLFYLDQLSLDAVARCVGRSKGTVGSWLHRGRRRLAARMEDYAPVAVPKMETVPAEVGSSEKGGDTMAWQGLTERARDAVLFANEQARRRGYRQVGTELLLLGLVMVGNPDSLVEHSVAAQLLVRLGVPIERVRREIAQQSKPGAGAAGQELTLTEESKRVIDLAYEASHELEPAPPTHWYVGTEHLLLGILREENGLGGKILRNLGADPEGVLRELPELGEKHRAIAEAARQLKEAKEAFYAFLAGV
jgi:RNA polymerase sigma factor (sigma-70 family)